MIYDTLRVISICKEEEALRRQLADTETVPGDRVAACQLWRERFEMRRAAEVRTVLYDNSLVD